MRSRQRGMSLVELLVVIAIIGVLLGLLLPSVQTARLAVQKMECANNLRQIGIAMHAFEESEGFLPPVRINPGTSSLPGTMYGTSYPGGVAGMAPQDWYRTGSYKVYNHTGFTLLLPYLEQDNLFRQYDLSKPSCLSLDDMGYSQITNAVYNNWLAGGTIQYSWDYRVSNFGNNGNCGGNLDVVGSYVKAYACPADEMPTVDTVTPPMTFRGLCQNARRSNYLMNVYSVDMERFGNTSTDNGSVRGWIMFGFLTLPMKQGMFADNCPRRIQDVSDGMSNTIAVGETRQERYSALFRSNPHWGAGHFASVAGAMRGTAEGIHPFFYSSLHINKPCGKTFGWAPNNPDYFKLVEYQFGSYHKGGANFMFGDGSVRFLVQNMSFAVYDAMGTIAGNEVIDERLIGN